MAIKAKAKGARQELRTTKRLEASGYTTTKAGGSLGVWDIVAISKDRVLLIQVKSNRPVGRAEWARMSAFECPPLVRKQMWIWKDYQKDPIVVECP